MARGSTALDNREYDNYLAKNKKERELRSRHLARVSKSYSGWHFGLGLKPVKTRDKAEFHHELEKRGCLDAHSMRTMMINGKKVTVHK